MENKIIYLNIESIAVNLANPRKTFDPADLDELTASIKEVGVLQPITVRPLVGVFGQEHQIVCGERRWRAARMAGLSTIPVIIRELTDDEAMDIAITENLQRKDVQPMEEADAFKYLLDKGQTIADLCVRFGKSEFYVRSRIKLLSMSEDFRLLLNAGDISISQAIEIAKFDADIQALMYKQHFIGGGYNNWSNLKPSAIYQSAVNGYTKELSRYGFDKTECSTCTNCSKNSCLFDTIEEAVCQNYNCLSIKDRDHKISTALKLQKQHPEACFVISKWDNYLDAKVELELQGHEVTVVNTYVNSVGAVLNKDIKNKVEAGDVKLVISVGGGECSLGYINNCSTTNSTQSDVKDLQDKDKRNIELLEEKTTSEVRSAVSDMDVTTMSAGELTEYEKQLTLFIVVKNLKKEQQEKIGVVESYYITDAEAWDIVLSASSEQVAYIHRCNILNKVGDHTRRDFKTNLFFEWVNGRDKTIVPTAELKNREIYLKRKEKIDARIAEIQLSKEDK